MLKKPSPLKDISPFPLPQDFPILLMKRLNYSHSAFDELTLICSPKEEKTPKKMQCFSEEFRAMLESLEEEDFLETGSRVEKKRRLTFDQVQVLDMNFELDNKLEPRRKVKLAAELDLQPRQVATWFQNRRARWKTKQLERDYSLLKANYDILKVDVNGLEYEKQNLTEQLMKLKSKLKGNGGCAEFPQQHQLMASTSSPQPAISFSRNTNGGPSSFESSMQFANSFDSRMMLENWNNPQFMSVDEQRTLAQESDNFVSIDQAPTLHWYNES